MRDPSFLEELKEKLQKNQAPLPALPKNILKKRAPNFLSVGVKRSFVLHGSLLFLFFVASITTLLSERDEKKKALEKHRQLTKQSIRVDMVDLPSMKLADMKDIDPTEEVGRPPKEEAVPAPPAPPPPSETAMKQASPEKKAEKPKDLFEGKKQKEDEAARLKEIRDRLRADARRKELISKLKGSEPTKEGGRPVLGGNIISQGNSLTGEVAGQADAYNGKIQAHLKRHWSMPEWVLRSKKSARIVVRIGQDGRVIDKEFTKSSNDRQFDDLVERAIDMANPFPPPPLALRDYYEETGVEWGFPN